MVFKPTTTELRFLYCETHPLHSATLMSSNDTKNLRGTIIFIDHVRIRPGAGPDSPKIRPGTADPKTRKFNYKNVILELGFGFRTQPPIPDLKIAKKPKGF